MAPKLDPHHNEFINTSDMLWTDYVKRMRDMGQDVPMSPDDAKERVGQVPAVGGQMFFVTSRPAKKGSVTVKSQGDVATDPASGEPITHSVEAAKVVKALASMKAEAVTLFEARSDDPQVAAAAQKIIRAAESAEAACGVEGKAFEPLRHISGLKRRGELENAHRVVANTLDSSMHTITSVDVKTKNERPVMILTVVGQRGDKGFVTKIGVAAKIDFSGNQAVDYVYAPGGGLASIKALENGRWIDVSDAFNVQVKLIEEADLVAGVHPHTLFVGKEIAGPGKEIILKRLNLTTDDVQFGERQIFAKDSKVLEDVRETIRANSQ